MSFNGHKKKVHIQIVQDETDGLSVSLILLSKDSWEIYSWEQRIFTFLTNNGWLAASLAASVILIS